MKKRGQLTSTSRPLLEQLDRDRNHPGDEAVLAAIEKLHAGSVMPTPDGTCRVTFVMATDDSAVMVIRGPYICLRLAGPTPVGHLRIVRGQVKDPWLPLWRLVETSLCYQRRKK